MVWAPLEVWTPLELLAPLEVVEVTVAPGVGWLLIRRHCHWSRCHSRIFLVVGMGVLRLVSVVDNAFRFVEGGVMVV